MFKPRVHTLGKVMYVHCITPNPLSLGNRRSVGEGASVYKQAEGNVWAEGNVVVYVWLYATFSDYFPTDI